MQEILYVFIGGGIGAVLRFIISMYWIHLSLHPKYENLAFPWPTFIANMIGCAMIGLFYHLSEKSGINPQLRLFLTTGLCGGFTTFSTFSLESINLLRNHNFTTFVIYVLSSIIIGMTIVFAITYEKN